VTDGPTKPPVFVGVKIKDEIEIIPDWKLLKWLNGLPPRKQCMGQPSAKPHETQSLEEWVASGKSMIEKRLSELAADYRIPFYEIMACLVPG